ncbi:GGDEF domain-containing protein [Paenibacillus nasutitermitis]|uniref:GGDEF domain-containing protein n=1 Tax=Paenibacillus nasutitermitis TaxID=1652958 RepID=A0A916YRX1_9BACL|nr:GGDEF domain-containing protein [Paenibacillus nasutitermitis]GGD58150.1 GGDEF domain-containing protein [Paenibacillus nasutitermitis]
MSLLLDKNTIFISLIAGHLFTLVLISAYRFKQPSDSTINMFFAAKWVQAIAWLILILSGGLTGVLTISLSNALLFAGASMETAALLMLQKGFNRKVKNLYIAITAFNIISFHMVILFNNVESVRISVASFSLSIVFILPAVRMVRERSFSPLIRMMGCLYFIVILSLIGRSVLALYSDQNMGLFTPSIYQTLTFLSLYLIMILDNTGFVLLSKERAEKELLHAASYDDLTGIFNRRTFVLRAKQCLKKYVSRKQPVSLILFDVDQFKSINDTYGHDAGDQVLKDLTVRIGSLLSPDDLFGRYGGDEFCILLPGRNDFESGEFAERIRESVEYAGSDGSDRSYTISLGVITVIPGVDTQLENLYTSCDIALYNAKKSGRNLVSRSTG